MLRFVREHRLVPAGSILLVAVSGGADSICLLHLLVRLSSELDIRLHVAHLDHMLRGAESKADADYVARLARELGVPATVEKRDVAAYRKEKRISLEEAAREVRYRFLADTASSVGAGRISTGHTQDDQLETILMHLVRGTGTRGLIGLKPVSQWKLNGWSVTIVRPLLEVSRQETAEYCQSHKLNPRMDTSNLELSPLRNRIRQQLLPLLKSYNPGVAQALLRASAIAGGEIAFLDGEVSRLWNEVVQKQEGVIILDKERFSRLPPALKRHLLRTAIEGLWGSLKDIEARHIQGIMAALDKPAGKQIGLPGGLVFSIEYDRYLLGLEPASLCPFPELTGESALKIPGETRLPGWQVEATVGKPEGTLALLKTPVPLPFSKGKGVKGVGLTDNLTACFDFDKTGDEIMVRTRKRGDSFRPLGSVGSKKLNEFMIDARIPRTWRERIPVVFSPEHILWLVGYRIDEKVKVTEATRQVLKLDFRRTED